MAKQIGPLFFTGCMGDLCFYKLDGQYYVRMKSSLSGKRVKKDPRFRLTMLYAGLMGQASKIASAVYRVLPDDKRQHALYRVLTGEALCLLKKGMPADAVKAGLLEAHQPKTIVVKPGLPAAERLAKKALAAESRPTYRLFRTFLPVRGKKIRDYRGSARRIPPDRFERFPATYARGNP